MPRQYFYGVSRYLKTGACLIQVLFDVLPVLGTKYMLAYLIDRHAKYGINAKAVRSME